jgi:iron complex outermembrane receptor protein
LAGRSLIFVAMRPLPIAAERISNSCESFHLIARNAPDKLAATAGLRFASAAWTDGRYRSYKDGSCPLELIGNATTVCDLSGRPLPGTPHSVYSVGGEYVWPTRVGRKGGEWYLRADATQRSAIYGDATDSKYTLIAGYTLLNASVGLRVASRWDLALWARNLLDRDYMQNLTVQAGNSGLVVGTPGDPRTWGMTLRAHW